MNSTHRHWYRSRVICTSVCLVGTVCACSSARLDPNSRALTLYAPTPRNSPSSVAADVPAPAPDPTSPPDVAALRPTEPKLPSCSSLPDPVPTRTDRWVALAVRFDKGVLDIASFAQRQSRRKETTRRAIGRFAAELWIGCELIDRVRFDFPLLGAEPAKTSAGEPSFEAAGRFEASIFVPDSNRATRLELVDRAKDTARRIFDWPIRLEANHGAKASQK